jgi:hypothetical protein
MLSETPMTPDRVRFMKIFLIADPDESSRKIIRRAQFFLENAQRLRIVHEVRGLRCGRKKFQGARCQTALLKG